MLLKQVHSSGRVFVHVLSSAALLVSQSPAVFAEFEVKHDLNDPFWQSDSKLLSRWLKPGEYMPVSDVKPGMEGYGLSVFHGTKPERFGVKVIGTVKKVLNGRDAILVRLSGPQIGKCNVIRGMSGSPVYINNKLIGAISYGFDFSLDPIAGVTPIAEMLDALNHEQLGDNVRDRISTAAPIALPPNMVPSVETNSNATKVSGGAPRMVPLMSPVSLAGFSPRAEQFLSEKFKDQGMWVSSGAGGGMDAELSKVPSVGQSPQHLVPPGGAVSVLLTSGDFVTSACGTATTTIGNHVLAFGHPFITAGAVEFPMATAFIHQVLPSLSVSFKMASPVQTIGSFLSDRPWAISGQIGKTAKMIPATYTVTDATRHIKRVFHCDIVDHPDLTPELIAGTAMSAIDATHQHAGPYILNVKSEIDASGVGVIQRTDRYSNGMHGKAHMGGDPIAAFLLSTTSRIIDNDFEQSSIKSVNLDISLEDGHNNAKIERIFVDKPIVEPGDKLDVHCVIRPYSKEPITKTLHLQIPRDVPDGQLLIGVSSGDDIDSIRKRMGLTDPPPENLSQIAKRIRDAGSGDTLTAILALPEQSIQVGGTVLKNPPAHWTKLFFSDKYTRGPQLVKSELRTSTHEDLLLDGNHIMTVEVRRSDKAASRSAPFLATSTGSYSTGDNLYMTEQARKTLDSFKKTDSKDAPAASGSTDKPQVPTMWTPSKEYPHMRSVLVWHQESNADFTQGKTDSTTVDSWGRVTTAYQDIAQKQLDKDVRIWSAVYTNGAFWFATSDKIYKWKGDAASTPQLVAEVKGLAIPSMVVDANGTIYFASVPGGAIYSLNTSGTEQKPRVIAKLQEQIITSLAVDESNNLYAGVTASGAVYQIPLNKVKHSDASADDNAALEKTIATKIFDSGQANVTCLFYSSHDHRLYVGTSEKGAVYSIDQNKNVRAEYQTQDHIVTGVAKDSKGDLYVATAAQGHLVKLPASGGVVNLASSDAFYTLHYDRGRDAVFSGDAEGDITHAQTDPLSRESYFVPVCHSEQEAILALASNGTGTLFAGTCNLAFARTFDMKPANNATYTSIVKDAGRTARWSRLRAYGAYNEVSDLIGKQIDVESRTGDTSQPDGTWSQWQKSQYKDEAYVLNAPAGRYMQYRLIWHPDNSTTSGGMPVAIGKTEVSYQPANSAPDFSTISLKTGSACSGKEDVTINAVDPDGDNLALAIDVSEDGGKTWTQVASNLRPAHSDLPARPGYKSAYTEKSSPDPANRVPPDSISNQPVKPNGLLPLIQGQTTNDSARSGANPSIPLDETRPTEKPSEPEPGKDDKDKSDKDQEKYKDKEARHDDGDKAKEGDLKKADAKESKPEKQKSKNKVPVAPATAKSSDNASSSGEKFTWTWDTSKLKDGSYLIKFTADDLPSNPHGHLQTIALRTVEVENAPPEITSVKLNQGKNHSATLVVRAHDKHTPIVNATYRFDDGEPFALGSADNITDGLDAEFTVNEITIPHGSHKLEVQVTNKAGNSATKTINVL